MEYNGVWRAYLILVFVLVSEEKQFYSVGGPFKVVVRRIENCIDQVTSPRQWQYYIHDARKKHGEELKYSGNHTLNFDLDNTSSGRVKFSSWSNVGGWQENAHRVVCKEVCKCFGRIGPIQWNIYQNIMFGEKIACPHLAGIYRFDNVTPDLNRLAIKHFIYGKWRLDAQLVLKTGDVAGCMRIFADTLPD